MLISVGKNLFFSWHGSHYHDVSLFLPRREKISLQGLQPGPTQTKLYKHRRWLEAGNFGFRKKRNCTIHVVEIEPKALISFTVAAKLICACFRICEMLFFSCFLIIFQYAHKLAYLVGQNLHKAPAPELSDRLFFL